MASPCAINYQRLAAQHLPLLITAPHLQLVSLKNWTKFVALRSLNPLTLQSHLTTEQEFATICSWKHLVLDLS